MEKVIAFFVPYLLYATIFLLNGYLPGRWVYGYITRPDSSEKMKYRLNGLFVLLFMVLLWILLGYTGLISYDWLYRYRWFELAGAFSFGIVFSLLMVLPYPSVTKSFWADLFLGRIENFQFLDGRIDAKMWLYLVGAVVLELNVLSFTSYHWMLYGENASPGIFLTAFLLTYFVVDYLTFEEVHLYTYDLFAERVGFKLGWGCLVFYPYFYAVSLWSTAGLPNPQTPTWLFVIYGLIFFAGWSLSRGANLQKFFFKKNPQKAFLGIVPETISDGNRLLLVNGFWGLSRHINYLGEILMGIGIILCAGYPTLIWPWLYPLYYVLLLFTRQMDDDKRCSLKYGKLWVEYKQKVPYKIIPFIY